MKLLMKCKMVLALTCMCTMALNIGLVDAESEASEIYVSTEMKEVDGTEASDDSGVTSENRKVSVTELDLGDYYDTMVVGEKQLLSVTVLPFDATETNITYSSSNTAVATINGMGRIAAVSVGNTTITAACDEKQMSFTLKVTMEENDEVPVNDIEIGNFEDELDVNGTMSLSATVLPADATDNTVTYKSSNTSVATVNSSGEVKGISKGSVKIYITAGNVIKEISLTVKEPTTGIEINKDYLVLEIGEEFRLEAVAKPEKAEQGITFKSVAKEIATVTEEGLVAAVETGSTVIIVSNGDYTATVSVIVNAAFSDSTGESDGEENPDGNDQNEEGATSGKGSNYEWNVNVDEIRMIDSDMLQQLYMSGEKLSINGDGYTLELSGEDVVNYGNVLYTDIALKETENGVEFCLNQGETLCGKITLCPGEVAGKYLYLYNESKQKYEMIRVDDITRLELTTAGKYLITPSKLKQGTVMLKYSLVGGSVLILVGVVIYIMIKKKHWFW